MHDRLLTGLLDPVVAHAGFRRLLRAVKSATGGDRVGPLGLPAAARPPVAAALARGLHRPVLWVVPLPEDARATADALRAYFPAPDRVMLLHAPDPLPYERSPWDALAREGRLAVLGALLEWRRGGTTPPVVVASARAALLTTLARDEFEAGCLVVGTGQAMGLSALVAALMAMGYEVAPAVTAPGEMARRGGIVDIYPPTEPGPVRIEWFGDVIESLRRYDPESQRSLTNMDEVNLTPAAEALPGRGPTVATVLQGLDTSRLHPLAQIELRRHREHLAAAERFATMGFYGPLLHPEGQTALDHMPADAWLVVDDPQRVLVAAEGVSEQAATVRGEQVGAGELPPDWPGRPVAPATDLAQAMERHPVAVLGQPGAEASRGDLSAAFGAPPRFGGRVDEAVLEAARLAEDGKSVVLVSRQAPRLAEMLGEAGLDIAPTRRLVEAPGPGGLALVHGVLGAGWTFGGEEVTTVLLTDGELFGWRMPRRRWAPRGAASARAVDYFSEYTPGDHVVHIEHGIGVFQGIERMKVGEVDRDYLHLAYAQGDVLYVPTHQADRVARYVGVGDVEPPISRLGTTDWDRAKQRARRAVEDIAEELLALYARREMARRGAFAADTPWQAAMEAAFPYVETDDQAKAIAAVKTDMESERPMDRLVVGDVGFGKTEVAVRAAFKAVMDGRQVAVLVPTTVLAQQHYDTFRRRMAAFPVRVEQLSRFRSRKDQKAVVAGLVSGEVDVVIGTHRLLGDDVGFRDLGLLIVDEEHRFGVKHKERLRDMKADVDTLTLTATPIPRTMHMALSGLRDLSTIDTPPEERLPVVTNVGPYDDGVVRQALRRELGRGGQVFYVFNRVRGIEMTARKVRRLVPDARVEVAHGQMPEDLLAEAMLRFAAGAVDVLVCTSIIESGLDIPNANTLIVEAAHRFGIAQLHQLRGRVGRGAQRAYAYFLIPAGASLPPDASSRLDAVAEAADLGAGFRLAMRDLEIRGAGDILGSRQHGQVAAVGLDLYTRLLAEAIKKLRADTPGEGADVSRELAAIDPGALPTVDLPLDAFLPESYVAETETRTRLYRRMATADDLAAVDDLAQEVEDRFGSAPRVVRNLLAVLRLRVMAHLARARGVGLEGGYAVIRWPGHYDLDRPALARRLAPTARIGRHQVSLPVAGKPEDWLPRLEEALLAVRDVEEMRSGPPSGGGNRTPTPGP